MPQQAIPVSTGAAAAALPARVTYDVAPAVLEACSTAMGEGARRFDLSACQDFDSSLIGILLELLRQAAAAGARLELANPALNLQKLAELYGVQGLLFQNSESS